MLQTVNSHSITHTQTLLSGQLCIDSSSFFLTDKRRQIIYEGDTKNWIANVAVKSGVSTDLTVPINKNNFIVRTFKKNVLEYTLAKENSNDSIVTIFPEILQKQQDGVFSNDGMLDYDGYNGVLVYLYYHRNQFISFDTNFFSLNRYRTIDTNTTAKIEISTISSVILS